jgi:hypothetical protein
MRYAIVTLLLIALSSPTRAEPLQLPDNKAQTEAANALREVFGREWGQAATPVQKSVFGKKLLESSGSPREDAAGCFVMLRTARDVGAQAGDVALVEEACGKLESNYAIIDARSESLQTLAKNCKGAAAFTALTEFALETALRHASAERFEIANACMTVAESAAKRAGVAKLTTQVVEEKKRLAAATTLFEQVTAAQATLDKSPTDPAANDTLGRYHCLHREDWTKGLSYLALSNDAKLAALAADDLRLPEAAAERLALGDRWWDQAEVTAEGEALRSRAAHWYRLALPELAGLTKVRVDKRVAEVRIASARRPNPAAVIAKRYTRAAVGDVWYCIGASQSGPDKGQGYNTTTTTITKADGVNFAARNAWTVHYGSDIKKGEDTWEGTFDGNELRSSGTSGKVINGVIVSTWGNDSHSGDTCSVPECFFDRHTMSGRWEISQDKVRGEFNLNEDGSATQTIQAGLKGSWVGTKDLAIIAWTNGWRSTINKDGTIASYADDSPMTKPPTSIGKAKQLP